MFFLEGKGKETLFIQGLQFKAVSLWGRVGEMLVFVDAGSENRTRAALVEASALANTPLLLLCCSLISITLYNLEALISLKKRKLLLLFNGVFLSFLLLGRFNG